MKMRLTTLLFVLLFLSACLNTSIENEGKVLGSKDGVDTLYVSENSYYFGEFEGGEVNGIGRTFLSSGNWYLGQWKNRKWSGIGEAYWSDGEWEGDHCIGTFKNHEMNGFCIYTTKDGTVTKGFYTNGLMDGIGFRQWGNNIWKGDYYLGNWKNGTMTGIGMYFDSSEDSLVKGVFKNGDLSNLEIISTSDSLSWIETIDSQADIVLQEMEIIKGKFKKLESKRNN